MPNWARKTAIGTTSVQPAKAWVGYGDRQDVRRNLAANFNAEGWRGDASDHHTQKRQHIQALYDQEEHPRVRAWLREYLDYLTRLIDTEKVRTRNENSDALSTNIKPLRLSGLTPILFT